MPYEGMKISTAIRGYIIRKNSEHRFCIAKTGRRISAKGLCPYDPVPRGLVTSLFDIKKKRGEKPRGKETNSSVSGFISQN